MTSGRRPGLALIGYRGTGKTTVGRLVAQRSGRNFIDADEATERRTGRSVASIFAEQGEHAFRELEQATIAELTSQPGLILATGGGAILREANRKALSDLGPVVWLVASPDEIAVRLSADPRAVASRPALTPGGSTLGEIEEVLRAREPHYRSSADLVLKTSGKSPSAVADEILNQLEQLESSWNGRIS